MVRPRKKSMQNLEDKLNEFKSNKPTPTSAIMNPMDEREKKSGIGIPNELIDMFKEKRKVEDTHTRRTFLVKNDLLKRLDTIANGVKSKGFKTEFINYVIEQGLEDLEKVRK